MSRTKQNSTENSVPVTLRIPSNIYREIKTVADEYETSIPLAFRIYIKQLRDCYNNIQQNKVLSSTQFTTEPNTPKQTPVEPVVLQQTPKKQTLQDLAAAWGDDYGDDDEA